MTEFTVFKSVPVSKDEYVNTLKKHIETHNRQIEEVEKRGKKSIAKLKLAIADLNTRIKLAQEQS